MENDMLKKYSISDIILTNLKNDSFYVGTFEGTEDPEIEWPHRHDFYSIVWFSNGYGVNVVDFDEYKIQANRLFFMKPKQIHNWSYSNDTRGNILIFDKHLVQNFPTELLSSVCFDLGSDSSFFVKTLFDSIITESGYKDEISEQFVTTGINLLLLKLSRLSSLLKSKIRTKSEEILRFSKLISDTVSDNVPVTTYARMMHITVERLNEICKSYYGQSPKKIILDKKLTEAKRLLYFTSLNIQEIAYQLGFEDSSYFSRIFKRKNGLSPSDFKNKST